MYEFLHRATRRNQGLLLLLLSLVIYTPVAYTTSAQATGPTDILLVVEGLVLHLDAGDLTDLSEGDFVYQWPDRSGRQSDATAHSGSAPT